MLMILEREPCANLENDRAVLVWCLGICLTLFLPSLRDSEGRGRSIPALKGWAIFGCPSGTPSRQITTRHLQDTILVFSAPVARIEAPQ